VIQGQWVGGQERELVVGPAGIRTGAMIGIGRSWWAVVCIGHIFGLRPSHLAAMLAEAVDGSCLFHKSPV
jgi:uncharacterized membrane protein YhiD involved in acid resistance